MLWVEPRYPVNEDALAQTAFGNAIRAPEVGVFRRWGLTLGVAWPRAELLLPERTLYAYTSARATVTAFANCVVLLCVVWVAVAVELVNRGPIQSEPPYFQDIDWGRLTTISLIMLLIGWWLYRGAVSAAVKLGTRVLSAVDLYRTDLYRQLGVRIPAPGEDETEFGRAISLALMSGQPVPDNLRAADPTELGVGDSP